MTVFYLLLCCLGLFYKEVLFQVGSFSKTQLIWLTTRGDMPLNFIHILILNIRILLTDVWSGVYKFCHWLFYSILRLPFHLCHWRWIWAPLFAIQVLQGLLNAFEVLYCDHEGMARVSDVLSGSFCKVRSPTGMPFISSLLSWPSTPSLPYSISAFILLALVRCMLVLMTSGLLWRTCRVWRSSSGFSSFLGRPMAWPSRPGNVLA